MPYSTLFIDLDNTLYDFSASSREAYEEVYGAMDYGRFFPSFEAYFDIYEKRNAELWMLYAENKISKDELNAIRYRHPLEVAGVAEAEAIAQQFFAEAMRRLPTKGILRPHAREALDYLRPRYRLFILSNGFSELQTRKMQSANILSYFEGIVLSDDIGVQKPQRPIFDHALAVAHATADEVLMIGDHFEVDIEGAHDAGWDQMYYNFKGDDTPRPFVPTFEIRSLDEIPHIL